MNALAAPAMPMACGTIANTGLPLFALIALGGLCLVGGVALLVLVSGRRGWRGRIAALLLLVGGLAFGIAASPSAGATASHCLIGGSTKNLLTITQASTITGLAPDIAPAMITGVVVNSGGDSTFVTSVTVSIATVTLRATAVAGVCDASDYVLVDPTMPVGVLVAPGGFTTFAGAKIGFNDKAASNQDACQGAVVGLSYVSA
jgi:hypothetical protein